MKQILILLVLLLTVTINHADEIPQPIPISLSAMAGIDYLIAFIKPTSQTELDPGRLVGLIDFIGTKRPAGATCRLPVRFKATPAYYEFDIKKNLRISYNLPIIRISLPR